MVRRLLPEMLPGGALNRRHVNKYTNALENAKDISSDAKKYFNPREPIFMKDDVHGKNINNLWTGYKLGGKGNLLMTGSLLGGGTIVASGPGNIQDWYNNKQMVRYDSEIQDVESLQSTRADGLGYQAQIGSSDMLRASGDLVFAMHKTRHSGQM